MQPKNTITNTTEQVRKHPSTVLADSLLLGPSAAIEAQEKMGQWEVMNSDTIPTDLGKDEALFEAMGFKLGPVVEGDPLFRYATLPPGWTKEATDHAMWSAIKDEHGRKRVGVFYKAAFYDRRATASITRRFGMDRKNKDAPPEDIWWVIMDKKTGQIAYEPAQAKTSYDACSKWFESREPSNALQEWEAEEWEAE